MSSWNRQGDQIVGNFTPRQIRWLREHIGGFYRALQHAGCRVEAEYGTGDRAPARPGVTAEPYQRAIAIVSTRIEAHPEAESLCAGKYLTSLNQMRDNAETVLTTLPPNGGPVVLPDPEQAWAWIWALHEYCMDMAIRLGIDPATRRPSNQDGHVRREHAYCRVRAWLMREVNALIDVVELPIP